MGGARVGIGSARRTLQPSSLALTFMATLAQSAGEENGREQAGRQQEGGKADWRRCGQVVMAISPSPAAVAAAAAAVAGLTLGAAAGGEADACLLGHHALGGHTQHRVRGLLHLAVQLLTCRQYSGGGGRAGGQAGARGAGAIGPS